MVAKGSVLLRGDPAGVLRFQVANSMHLFQSGGRPRCIGMLNPLARPVAMALVVVHTVLPAGSQQRKPAEDITPTIQIEVNLVNILATVRDKHGAFINNLAKDDFILAEDRQLQQIKYFARETHMPLTIGLLVDVSNSQRNLINIEREAAYQFFSQVLRKNDVAFLMSFGGDAELLQDFTGSPRLLQAALERLTVNSGGALQRGSVPTIVLRGGTVLYDAVHLAVTDRLVQQVGRKAIVLITDGIDAGSQLKLEEAVKAAQQADAVIYSICYFDPSSYSYDFDAFGGKGDFALGKMSGETGGRVFRVDKKHPLTQVFDELQQELRSQYAIGYTPTNGRRDGAFRRVDLRTRDHNLKVQARKGYYAIPPQN